VKDQKNDKASPFFEMMKKVPIYFIENISIKIPFVFLKNIIISSTAPYIYCQDRAEKESPLHEVIP